MKTTKVFFILIFIAGFITAGFRLPGSDKEIALAIKVIHDVAKKTAEVDWTTAKKGDFLYNNDMVRTGPRSIAIVKFKDNSMLRVRENAELKLTGEQKDGKFNKTVHVEKGEFTFDIQKQENEVFTFSSPTSVAAIRGTAGNMGSNENGDLMTVLHGLVNLFNSFSKQSVDVGAGQTGISNNDGTIYVRDSSQDEKNDAQNSLNATHNSGKEKELDIQLKDKEGNNKTLKIKYRD